jgi:hypothetical protein
MPSFFQIDHRANGFVLQKANAGSCFDRSYHSIRRAYDSRLPPSARWVRFFKAPPL